MHRKCKILFPMCTKGTKSAKDLQRHASSHIRSAKISYRSHVTTTSHLVIVQGRGSTACLSSYGEFQRHTCACSTLRGYLRASHPVSSEAPLLYGASLKFGHSREISNNPHWPAYFVAPSICPPFGRPISERQFAVRAKKKAGTHTLRLEVLYPTNEHPSLIHWWIESVELDTCCPVGNFGLLKVPLDDFRCHVCPKSLKYYLDRPRSVSRHGVPHAD